MVYPQSSRWHQDDDTSNNSADNSAGSTDAEDHTSATAFWRDALRQIGRLKTFSAYFVAAKSDLLLARVRSVVVWSAVMFVGMCVLAGVLVACGVLLVTGLADAISRVLGTGPWAGRLIASAVLLGLVSLGFAVILRRIQRRWRLQLERKYEHLHHQQRAADTAPDIIAESSDGH